MMVYVNGDSYACISDGLRYSDVLGANFKCETMNSAIAGSSNPRIFRTSLRDLIRLKSQHDQLMAVVSLTFPLRTELWDAGLSQNRFVNDGEFTSIQTTVSKSWFYASETSDHPRYKKFIDQYITWYNVEAETMKLLQEIILFTTWCKHNDIRYVIFSGPLQEPVDVTAPFIQDFYAEVCKDPNVINIFENSFTEWCTGRGFTPIDEYTQEIHGRTYDIGHHGEQAHRAFANYLMENFLREI
jgi:hypothetical protein